MRKGRRTATPAVNKKPNPEMGSEREKFLQTVFFCQCLKHPPKRSLRNFARKNPPIRASSEPESRRRSLGAAARPVPFSTQVQQTYKTTLSSLTSALSTRCANQLILFPQPPSPQKQTCREKWSSASVVAWMITPLRGRTGCLFSK